MILVKINSGTNAPFVMLVPTGKLVPSNDRSTYNTIIGINCVIKSKGHLYYDWACKAFMLQKIMFEWLYGYILSEFIIIGVLLKSSSIFSLELDFFTLPSFVSEVEQTRIRSHVAESFQVLKSSTAQKGQCKMTCIQTLVSWVVI